ncbi:MAG: transcription elongation factor spt5 [Watsoniomyces obsoletus]|nr:MAG: transcription elongation factor spt5 [Watsoniomyces obsoletus]
MSQTFTQAEVASHNRSDSLWVVVDGDVYDMTTFQDEHPGGKKILQRVGGKDASKQFWKYHNQHVLQKYKAKLQVGSLDTKTGGVNAPPTPPATPPPASEDKENKKFRAKDEAMGSSGIGPGSASPAPIPTEDDLDSKPNQSSNGEKAVSSKDSNTPTSKESVSPSAMGPAPVPTEEDVSSKSRSKASEGNGDVLFNPKRIRSKL